VVAHGLGEEFSQRKPPIRVRLENQCNCSAIGTALRLAKVLEGGLLGRFPIPQDVPQQLQGALWIGRREMFRANLLQASGLGPTP
jgi:hypothetical protein